MRAIVTGSHGFIGLNLVEALRERGWAVFEYDTKIGKDILDQDGNFPDCDVIFHLACINQQLAEEEPTKSRFVNAYGALQMANHAEKCGAKLIYTSTASVYGQAKLIPTPSDAPTAPQTAYARDKLKGESFVRASGADWTILRLSNVYGPHQTVENPYCGVVGRFFDQALKGERITVIGDGYQTRDFTYVEDVVKCLIACTTRASHWNYQIFNVSSGVETSINSLAIQVLKLVGKDHDIVTTKRRSVDGVRYRCLEPNLLCGTSLDEGLRLTYEWIGKTHSFPARAESQSPGTASLTQDGFSTSTAPPQSETTG